MAGSPTCVVVSGAHVLAGVDSSDGNYTNPSGQLVVMSLATQQIIATLDVGGQPDSIMKSPSGKHLVVVIENQREEELGNGENPQMPAGFAVHYDMHSSTDPAQWTKTEIALTGLPGLRHAEDPEPEFVAINDQNHAVVTLQENNGIVIIDLNSLEVVTSFTAGGLTLHQVDLTEDTIISQMETHAWQPREPDGVWWYDSTHFVTADEGDMDGGTRSFTVFNTDGKVVYSSGSELEWQAVRMGHWNEDRAANKGNEPENIMIDTFDGARAQPHEHFASPTACIYNDPLPTRESSRRRRKDPLRQLGALVIRRRVQHGRPCRAQAAPGAPVRPAPRGGRRRAGARPIRGREREGRPWRRVPLDDHDLRASGGARRVPDDHVGRPRRRHADRILGALGPRVWPLGGHALFGRGQLLPQVSAARRTIYPLARPRARAQLRAALTSTHARGCLGTRRTRFFQIDASFHPALLYSETRIRDPNRLLLAKVPSTTTAAEYERLVLNSDSTVNIDAEGIEAMADGTVYIVSEGRGTVGDADRPVVSNNLVLHVTASGDIAKLITLPDAVNAIQVRYGLEGIAYDSSTNSLVAAFQRAWGSEPNPRLGVYDLASDTWTKFIYYTLTAPVRGWVGIGDIHALGNMEFLVLERDNQAAPTRASSASTPWTSGARTTATRSSHRRRRM